MPEKDVSFPLTFADPVLLFCACHCGVHVFLFTADVPVFRPLCCHPETFWQNQMFAQIKCAYVLFDVSFSLITVASLHLNQTIV